MKKVIGDFVGDACLHFGWALFGQECNCGNFNWLARMMPEDTEMDEADIEASWRFKAGSFFVDLSNKLTTYL